MKAKKTYLMTYHIAGLQYYDALEVWSDLKTGLELTIEPELDNKYDRHALAVKWKDAKLGYIPRGENRHMAKILKAGWNPYQVLIESIYEDRPMNERIELCVRILDKGEKCPVERRGDLSCAKIQFESDSQLLITHTIGTSASSVRLLLI